MTRAFPRKKFHHKLRADSQDITTQRQYLENHMAVKNVKDDGESFRVDSMEWTENVADICKRRNRKIRAAKEDVAHRRETLRSYTALKNSDGQGCQNSVDSSPGGITGQTLEGAVANCKIRPSVNQIAKKYNKSAAQILVKWCLQ
ncbi:unnamed protein product [Calypogeia fissa]